MNNLIDLTDEQKLVREYIRQNPGQNTEEVCDYFDPAKDDHDRRREIASAVGFLTANSLLRRDRRTGALYHVEDVQA